MQKFTVKSVVLLLLLSIFLLVPSYYTSSEEVENPAARFEELGLDSLDKKVRDKAVELMDLYPCSCPCEKENIKTCIEESPQCQTSIGLAKLLISSIKAGVPESEINEAFSYIGAEKDKYKNLAEATKKQSPPDRYKVDVGTAPYKGPEDAPVTIVEFSEYECPFCSRVQPVIEQIMKVYPGKIKHVFKNNPLAFHKNAFPAAEASMEAHRQGKFWQMHDKMFSNQRNLKKEDLIKYAEEIKLDIEAFKKNLNEHTHEDYIKNDMKQASSLGVTGTPTFFINGKKIVGAKPFEFFKKIIDEELKNTESTP